MDRTAIRAKRSGVPWEAAGEITLDPGVPHEPLQQAGRLAETGDMTTRELLDAGFRYAISLTGRRSDAEDLVQEAWIRLERSGGATHRGQLYVTIRHLFIDGHRHRACLTLVPLEEYREPSDPDDEIDTLSMQLDLAGPLSHLRDDEREVLFLHVVEGYTAQEIASLTGRPRGTILSLAHRAKRKLRAELERDSEQPAASACR